MHRSTRILRSCFPMLMCLALVPAVVRADWGPDGVSVEPFGGRVTSQSNVRLSETASGDLFVAIMGGGTGSSWRVRRIAPDGSVPAGWGAFHRMSSGANSFAEYAAAQVPTIDDGLFLCSWSGTTSPSQTVHLQRVAADASTTPATTPFVWPIQGAISTLSRLDAVTDGADGVFVAWTNGNSLRMHRRLADGSLAPGWSATGRVVGTAADFFTPVMLRSDGFGGAVVAWIDAATLAVRALRVLADGSAAPGWPASGLPMSTTAVTPYGEPYPVKPFLVPSGTGHFIAAWAQQTGEFADRRIRVQRFGLDGALDPTWPAEGIVALEGPDSLIAATVVADGEGGVHVAGRSGRDWRAPYVWSHLDASGQFVTPGGAAGQSPLDPGALLVGPYGEKPPVIAAAPGGGLLVAWDDARHGVQHVRMRALLADGTTDPAEPDTGRVASGPLGEVRAVRADGAGGAYVAFARYDEVLFQFDIRMQRLYASDVLPVPPTQSPSGLRLAAPWPQPARGAFTVRYALASGQPARLELFDLSGRRVQSRDATGTGEQTARLEVGSQVAPGLYHLRLTQGADQRAVRVVLTQ